MKILFSPSEAKIAPDSEISESKVLDILHIDFDFKKNAISQYSQLLKTAPDSEIQKIFGSKKIDLHTLALSQNLLNAPRTQAIKLYSGVAYKALDFENLPKNAQEYILKNTFISSNLFGLIRASDKIPFYKLNQNYSNANLNLKNLYTQQADLLDKEFLDSEILDLRAEVYIKAYTPKAAHTRIEFVQNGKKISHHSKHFRGLFLREMALKNIAKNPDLQNLKSENLKLIDKKFSKQIEILVFEAQQN